MVEPAALYRNRASLISRAISEWIDPEDRMPRTPMHLVRRSTATLIATAFVAAIVTGARVQSATARTAQQAHAYTVREYTLPHSSPAAFAHDPAVGRDGIVWFADQPGSYIGRLDPETGEVKEYPTPTPGSGPHGIIVSADGMVWYTGNAKGLIGRLDPKTGKITEFQIEGARDPHTPLPYGDKIWFTAQQSQKYGVLDPATGAVKLWDAPPPRSNPYGLQRAPDGSLWIAMFARNALGHVDPKTGDLTMIALPNDSTRPRRLAVTSDGRVWYTDYSRGYLGMYDPKTKATKEWKTPSFKPETSTNPYGIGVAPDGKVWFNEARPGNMVVFDPKTEKMEVVPIPTKGSVVRNVSVDSTRGRLWLALSGTSRLGRIDLK
jgi:virginiamycin B lyase